MSARRLRAHVLLLPLGLLTAAAGAIVIRHDRPDAAYRELAAAYPFCSLNLGGWGGGCTLIDAHWVVTAAHAAGRLEEGARIEVGGESVRVAAVIVHPNFDDKSYRNDLALLRLAEPVRDQTPVALYKGRDEVGRRVIFVGRGYFGTGESGPDTADKVLRAAENRIEDAGEHWLRFVFDAPPDALEREGISGPADSGGPAFLETEDGLALVGVSSWQDNREQGTEGAYGVKEYYARVSSYVSWIEETFGGARFALTCDARSRFPTSSPRRAPARGCWKRSPRAPPWW
jgi:hypothetical protein